MWVDVRLLVESRQTFLFRQKGPKRLNRGKRLGKVWEEVGESAVDGCLCVGSV